MESLRSIIQRPPINRAPISGAANMKNRYRNVKLIKLFVIMSIEWANVDVVS